MINYNTKIEITIEDPLQASKDSIVSKVVTKIDVKAIDRMKLSDIRTESDTGEKACYLIDLHHFIT